ncbi:MAG: GH92 family glycosyl hydrolase [Bacteroidales bacterium]|nr:GH92 family glycosyl hydrolase [Bacteroidales bacterium]
MKYYLALLFSFSLGLLFAQENKNFIQFVNPFVGTQNMGHTFPGATRPFGMVQLSPETDTQSYALNGKYNPDVYAYCSGYQYKDSTIVGFSHTHFSGTGHSDLGDFLIMPTVGNLQLNPGTADAPETGYRSRFSHKNEVAEPDYYQVYLTDYKINAELTSSIRVGFHRYTFPKTDSANIILDLMSGIYNFDEKNVWTFVRVENDTLITGYRQTQGWARTRTVYFALSFSKPIKSYGHKKYDQQIYKGFWRKFDETKNFPEMAGRQIRTYFQFATEENEQILLKFALSSTSTEGALKNLKGEIPGWDFDKTKKEGQAIWNKELSKIDVQTLNLEDKETFYTALYHSFLSPIEYMDIDGAYKGLDGNIHYANDFTNYTIFSLWDTFRALHPLFNLIQPKRNKDMMESLLAHFDQSVHPMLPVWSHYSNENWCMIGYHSVSLLADAMTKKVLNPNSYRKALDASVKSANIDYYDGLGFYKKLGFVPDDKNPYSVSKTLEYAYDDWCISEMAKQIYDTAIAQEFSRRALSYQNVFHANQNSMAPKLENGNWRKDFDKLSTHGQGFIEGNAWNYSLYVPHHPGKLVELMDGKKAFEHHLDSLFTQHLADHYFENTEDITRDGIIGLYVHGNEPSHHIPFLYNWTSAPWKTQARVRMIMKTMYANTKDGLCGNDDAGQMSAWYVFNALGFYPVAPGSANYSIGSPLVVSALLHFENGKKLQIKVQNQSDKNVYIQSITLNNKKINRLYLTHSELIAGGLLEFKMGKKPNKEFGFLSN